MRAADRWSGRERAWLAHLQQVTEHRGGCRPVRWRHVEFVDGALVVLVGHQSIARHAPVDVNQIGVAQAALGKRVVHDLAA